MFIIYLFIAGHFDNCHAQLPESFVNLVHNACERRKGYCSVCFCPFIIYIRELGKYIHNLTQENFK
jgi:Zn-finger protein